MSAGFYRRVLTRWVMIVAVGIAAPFCVCGQDSADRLAKPNVLFIAVDDLRPELGCYGETAVHSPHIDALAQSGVLFERAYCQLAVCNPSRVSIMTGLRPDTTKVWDLVTRFRSTIPDAVTLPQHLIRHGYYAASFGKIFHNPWPDNQSWSQPHRWPEKRTLWSAEAKARQAQYKEKMRAEGRPERRIARIRPQATEVVDIDDHLHIDGAIAKQAFEAMERLSKTDQPFFLAAGFVRPHLPFVVPRKYWDLYDRESIALAKNAFLPKQSPGFAMNTMYELRDYIDFDQTPSPDQGPLDEAQQRRLKHGYYASVSFIDSLIGELLGRLDALGLADKTIVVLWSDHGWKLGEHNSWCKQTNYEIDARVPLIIRKPGAAGNGKATSALVELVDLYPTLCELTGLPVPSQLEGESLAPLLADPNQSWERPAFNQFRRQVDGEPAMGYAMRTDRYRYIEWQNRRTGKVVATELYDHHHDPGENSNVAGAVEHESLLGELHRQMWATLPPPPKYSVQPKPRPEIVVRNDRDEPLTMRSRQKRDADWIRNNDPRAAVPGYVSRAVEGWPVRIREQLLQTQAEATERALELLAEQLRTVKRLIPQPAVERLIDVPIWFSPKYEGFGPSGEYHPGADWLAKQGRHPKLHRCVEFTNIPIFEREVERMPVLVIHELAHAYHDQVLGFDHSEVRTLYEIAKNNGSYDAVLRGNGKTEKAYAMSNEREYFAETSEAYFGRNDFYPFDRAELETHDPRMVKLLEKLWQDRSEP
ncbi:sulfatase-like hydrolase/transferase [Stieleria magnilauensis]|uniref:Choline-sulfatase n=1 Tax=Stieleria magnilauensis TaxID=2527963 RepID=A0ABX5XI83_9BACT|nr:Choline-sulfatase [Planctomycetes bacterium TBK1r]